MQLSALCLTAAFGEGHSELQGTGADGRQLAHTPCTQGMNMGIRRGRERAPFNSFGYTGMH